METTQLQQNHPPNTNEANNQDPSSTNLGGGGGGILGNSKNTPSTVGSNYLCRQSSTRWTPTTEQIKILKELYYNYGIRSPTADQIQRISARLRQFGKIEGKNVFYWFQNHKARERQKKRFTGNDLPSSIININNMNFTPVQRTTSTAAHPLPPTHLHVYNNNNNHSKHLYHPNISPAPPGVIPCSTSSSPAAGVLGVGVGVGQIGGCPNNNNYGSVAMERSFRECSISQGEVQNCGWVGVEHQYPTTYHTFLDKTKPSSFDQQQIHETLDHQQDHDHQEEEDQDQQETPELETLPLFPMHGDHYYNSSNAFFKSPSSGPDYYSGVSCYRSTSDYTNGGGSRASLELSLNSYTGWTMDLHH